MRVLFIWALVAMPWISLAQSSTITGVVVEESAKGKLTPIPNAAVQWLGTSTGTFTDSLGVFNLEKVAGAKRVVIQYLGYQNDTVQIGNDKMITVVLKSASNLKEVRIEYRTKGTEVSLINPIKVQQINQKELFKAACCNLSESFETNPSVDIAYTDAITGAKQIQLLGLAGPYTQITLENIPTIRGLSSINGLGQLPGTWIEGMQLSKGTGSVVNGYESIAGQLNVELHKPYDKDRVLLNGYASQGGRLESNAVINQQVSERWSTGLMMHASTRTIETDMNKDGFMDNPTGTNYKLLNRWDYRSELGFESQLGVSVTSEDRLGGQLSSSSIADKYRFDSKSNQVEAFVKSGYVFPENRYKSIGVQLSAQQYNQVSNFGQLNSYAGDQQTLYGNAIYQSIIGTTDHKFRTGLSFIRDGYQEVYNATGYNRTEQVVGAFYEYTWAPRENFTLVGGLRADQNSIFGFYATPRLHIRYAYKPVGVFRFSGGLGRKTANIFADNSGLMATSRQWVLSGNRLDLPYNLQQEKAWNFGINYTKKFELDYREGVFSIDYYRTDFQNQVITDLDVSARNVYFYNLAGKSFANSLQVEVDYELFKHLDFRAAYRYYDIQMQYSTKLDQRPLISKHRAFVNVGYTTRSEWAYDFTANWVGRKRLPFTGDNPLGYQLSNFSKSYWLFNAQVTKTIREKFAVYLGVENLANFKQNNAIVAANEPNGQFFDSSMIWGPVFGRMAYIGFRYTLKK